MRVTSFCAAMFLLAILAGCVSQPQGPYVKFDSVTVAVEVADTYETLLSGLMYRTNLSKNTGMLFVFSDEEPRTFWMKNTLISLDMIHIASNGTVVDIITANPCRTDPCPTYSSSKAAKYILEVNAGFASEQRIQKGTITTIHTESRNTSRSQLGKTSD